MNKEEENDTSPIPVSAPDVDVEAASVRVVGSVDSEESGEQFSQQERWFQELIAPDVAQEKTESEIGEEEEEEEEEEGGGGRGRRRRKSGHSSYK